MKRRNLTEARKDLFRLADEVTAKREEIILTRRGKKDVILVSQEEWRGVKEKAIKYDHRKKKKESMAGSIILKTRDLEADIRRLRKEFARSLAKFSAPAD
jgi:prevent-host-death family protein